MDTLAVRRISIPLIDQDAPAPRGSQTVLLVTGDGDFRTAAARALEGAGYAVLPAAHSGHALLAAMTAPRIDAIVVELSMDDTSGPALSEKIRRQHPELSAIYVARSGTPECDNVLVRPFTRDDLLDRLDSLAALCA